MVGTLCVDSTDPFAKCISAHTGTQTYLITIQTHQHTRTTGRRPRGAQRASGYGTGTQYTEVRAERRLLSHNNDFRENTPHVARQGVLYEVLSTHY
jgi:hypothetical protein